MLHPPSISATARHFQFQFCPHYLSLFLGIFGDFWWLPCVCVVWSVFKCCTRRRTCLDMFHEPRSCHAIRFRTMFHELMRKLIPLACDMFAELLHNWQGKIKREREMELEKGSWGYPGMCCVIIRSGRKVIRVRLQSTNLLQIKREGGGGTYQTRPLWG